MDRYPRSYTRGGKNWGQNNIQAEASWRNISEHWPQTLFSHTLDISVHSWLTGPFSCVHGGCMLIALRMHRCSAFLFNNLIWKYSIGYKNTLILLPKIQNDICRWNKWAEFFISFQLSYILNYKQWFHILYSFSSGMIFKKFWSGIARSLSNMKSFFIPSFLSQYLLSTYSMSRAVLTHGIYQWTKETKNRALTMPEVEVGTRTIGHLYL